MCQSAASFFFFQEEDGIRDASVSGVQTCALPIWMFAVLCIDHPVVQGMLARLSERRILTYGISPQADIRATNIRLGGDGSRFDAVIADRVTGQERVLADLFLPMFGEHNVQNSLTVLALAEEMGLVHGVVRATLRNFKGG